MMGRSWDFHPQLRVECFSEVQFIALPLFPVALPFRGFPRAQRSQFPAFRQKNMIAISPLFSGKMLEEDVGLFLAVEFQKFGLFSGTVTSLPACPSFFPQETH